MVPPSFEDGILAQPSCVAMSRQQIHATCIQISMDCAQFRRVSGGSQSLSKTIQYWQSLATSYHAMQRNTTKWFFANGLGKELVVAQRCTVEQRLRDEV